MESERRPRAVIPPGGKESPRRTPPGNLIIDLVPLSLTIAPRTITIGGTNKPQPGTIQVRNQGTTDSPSGTLQVRLSKDRSFSDDDLVVGSLNLPAVKAGATTSVVLSISFASLVAMNSDAGAYFVVVELDADNNINETIKSNNAIATNAPILTLAVPAVSGPRPKPYHEPLDTWMRH